jgi:hypothetical protein
MKNFQRLCAIVAIASSFAGCANSDFSFVTESALLNPPTTVDVNGLVTDSFNPSTQAPNVDMLFCVDSSGSMADDQQALGDNFAQFINTFSTQNVNFHIGIITSDILTSNWGAAYPGYVSPEIGKLMTRYSSYPVLTPSTPDYIGKFKENVKVGTSGSGYEQCLGSFLAATETSRLTGSNAGLFRADSLQSFIIISDEDETITDGEAAADRIQRLKDRVSSLRTINSRGSRFDFVVNKSAAPSYPAANSGNRPYPEVYYQAASALPALTYDIATNFAANLLQISEGIVNQAQNEFKLAYIPANPSEILVKISGSTVPESGSNGWIFHADRNTIELTGATADAADGKTLTVTYMKK